MIDNIKNTINYIEEIRDIERFNEDCQARRYRLKEDIEKCLKSYSISDSTLNNDIFDLVSMAKEEGVLIGIYYGVKLSNSINGL